MAPSWRHGTKDHVKVPEASALALRAKFASCCCASSLPVALPQPTQMPLSHVGVDRLRQSADR